MTVLVVEQLFLFPWRSETHLTEHCTLYMDVLSSTFSLMLDGRFSTLLKCSAHRFKIASLSVRRVLPSSGSLLNL